MCVPVWNSPPPPPFFFLLLYFSSSSSLSVHLSVWLSLSLSLSFLCFQPYLTFSFMPFPLWILVFIIHSSFFFHFSFLIHILCPLEVKERAAHFGGMCACCLCVRSQECHIFLNDQKLPQWTRCKHPKNISGRLSLLHEWEHIFNTILKEQATTVKGSSNIQRACSFVMYSISVCTHLFLYLCGHYCLF